MTTVQGSSGEAVHLSAAEVGRRADTSHWFLKEIKIPPATAKILEQYSKIPVDQIEQHVLDLRTRAFEAWPYPCIGLGRFLDLTTSKHPDYDTFLDKVKQGGTFLDAGCCLGQDLRKLLYDGAPSSAALYGTDLEGAFFGLGYELFRDRETLQSHFVAADLTKPLETSLESWKGGMDVISAQSLFHLFRLAEQKAVGRALALLSRAKTGSIISGRQIGHLEAGERRGMSEDSLVYMHSEDSWRSFWRDVGEETGSRWQVKTWVTPPTENTKKQPYYCEGMNFLAWTVTREA